MYKHYRNLCANYFGADGEGSVYEKRVDAPNLFTEKILDNYQHLSTYFSTEFINQRTQVTIEFFPYKFSGLI